ncbi:MAG: hypothetical protein K9H25_06445 [Rhodospirillum sp.]|nr:hypothetical protein [Rhodospirillum sp.]MCF8489053.1 hypothetical protein [Rhodospirillum sp.]MCF8499758.1 hypothetical protein [Rhodospirillum sp.]
MSVTTKVTGSTNAFSAVANTRFGDGIRATSASESFSPILESSAASNVGPQDESLRNDEWGTGTGQDRGRSVVPPSQDPVRLGGVKASNDFSQALFQAQSREASRGPVAVPNASRTGTTIYESNMRVIAARFSGEKLTGGTINRYY